MISYPNITYIVCGNLEGAEVYLCKCCHTPKCEPDCITASLQIARRFDSQDWAIETMEEIAARRPKIFWYTRPMEIAPMPATALLGNYGAHANG